MQLRKEKSDSDCFIPTGLTKSTIIVIIHFLFLLIFEEITNRTFIASHDHVGGRMGGLH